MGRGIESYVDALGQIAGVNDSATSPAFKDDEPFYELLVSVHWCGVTTVEQAKEALLKEVDARSVGKSDLGLLLSSVDHTAFRLYGTMPEPFKEVHGEDLVEGITQHLLGEEFDKTLTRDPRWAEFRKRWIKLGWRGSNEETFNATFTRAAAERTAEIHDGQGEGALAAGMAVMDTILDERIARERPDVRKKMMDAFATRLDREWGTILLLRAERVASDADKNGRCPFCGKLVSVRWGDPPIDPGSLTHEMPTCVQYDTMTADEFVRAVVAKNRERGRTESIDVTLDPIEVRKLDTIADGWNTTRNDAMERLLHKAVAERRPGVKVSQVPPEKQSKEPYSDHELMRRGRVMWEMTYAKGMSDEEVRDSVGTLNLNSFADEIVLFAAKWAVHAFQRLMTSHTFAAALMCSDVQKDVLVGIEKHWDAFLVIVPNGMLLAGELEFSRILVATYSFGARIMLMTFSPTMTGTVTDDAPTLSDLLVSDGSDLTEDSVSRRCLIMAKRLVAGLLLNLQHPAHYKARKVEARPKSKGREAEPEHRIVTVGKPLEIDCRAAVKEYIEHGKAGRKHAPPSVQVMVRGHYRNQACGVGRMERKTIWIEPHWRGPEAALIQTRPKVPS